MKKIILIMAVICTLILTGCNDNNVDNENSGNNISGSEISGENSENSGEDNSMLSGENVGNGQEAKNTSNLADEEAIEILGLDFSNTLEITIGSNKIVANVNEMTIDFYDLNESSENISFKVPLKGIEGTIKSMKYSIDAQALLTAYCAILTEQGDVYLYDWTKYEQEINDSIGAEESSIQEFVMDKIEAQQKVESIASYEIGSKNILALKYENGTYGAIDLDNEKQVRDFSLMKDLAIKTLISGDYKTAKVLKDTEEVAIDSALDIELHIGKLGPDNAFGLSANTVSGDTYLSTIDDELVVDFQNNMFWITEGTINESKFVFNRFEYEIDRDTNNTTIRAFISAPEEIVVEFEKI